MKNKFVPAVVFGLLAITLYGDVLFSAAALPAAPGTDLQMQFISWREFGFREMSAGNVPLWNPHIFGGTPYMASFQSALFYPLNWLHFFLPTTLAISWYCAIHTFLMGFFTSLWAKYRGASLPGQILSGVMMMFSGQYFLHAFAGHLPHLAVMAWAPLILLAIDALADGKNWRYALAGIIALAMQILGGHPQYVFYTGLFVSLYMLLRFIFTAYRLRLIIGTWAIYVGGVLLACIQLLPGIEAARENIRTGGLPYEMASQFSVHPLQWVTVLAPYFFGDQHNTIIAGQSVGFLYSGPGYLWELCLFVSLTGLCLAILGLARTTRQNRIVMLISLGVLLLLAAGRHTLLHRILYDHLPFFGSFRVPGKFLFFVSLLLSILAAEGLVILQTASLLVHRRFRNGLLIAAGAVIILMVLLAIPQTDLWSSLMQWLQEAPDRFMFRGGALLIPEVSSAFLHAALVSLALAAATLLLLVGALVTLRNPRNLVIALVLIACTEMIVFAAVGRGSMPAGVAYPPQYAQLLEQNPQRYRTLHLDSDVQNLAMSFGTYEMWGYDPGVLRRYGLLISASQGVPPERASQYVTFRDLSRVDSLYQMFRLKWIIALRPQPGMLTASHPMEQAMLIGSARVIPSPDGAMKFVLSKDFDPRKTVVLERAPAVNPSNNPQGEAKVTNLDTDTLVIDVKTDRAAILLVTDNYASGWKAYGLDPAPQSHYDVLPANSCLRAIPIVAGTHRILLEYRPASFVLSNAITAISAAAYLICVLAAFRQQVNRFLNPPPAAAAV